MRHAFGKPAGTVARVQIYQPLISIRCRRSAVGECREALRRAKYKVPGRQEIVESDNYGFTHFSKEEYVAMKADGRLKYEGNYARIISSKGPLNKVQ